MRMTLTSYGMQALQRGLAELPEQTRRELLAWATEATLLIQADVVGAYPKHTGTTRASITADAFSTPTGVLGVVGSAAPVAVFVELGTKPHFPPLQPLVEWVADILGQTGPDGQRIARAIQRKIGRQGSKPRPQFQPALDRNWGTLFARLQQAADRIGAALPGQGPAGGAA